MQVSNSKPASAFFETKVYERKEWSRNMHAEKWRKR